MILSLTEYESKVLAKLTRSASAFLADLAPVNIDAPLEDRADLLARLNQERYAMENVAAKLRAMQIKESRRRRKTPANMPGAPKLPA